MARARHSPLHAAVVLLAALGVAGCGDVDESLARWSYISPAIFEPACATSSCHSPAAAVSGLDFSTPGSGYKSLTDLWVWVAVSPDGGTQPPGVPCATVDGTFVCERMLRPLVTPHDPSGSRLVNMLRARDAPRMPPDRSLPEAQIRLVERWILNGACEVGVFCGQTILDAAADRAPADAGADARPGQ